jgi:glycosyltransferase involved in cell wall biosynthesis
MSQMPTCSVIIPAYYAAATIEGCLRALGQQIGAPPHEIIVVNSSHDETPDLVRRSFPAVRLIHLAQRTDPALARNIGAEQARGQYLMFIDADCIAAPDWLQRLAATLELGYDAVGGAIANGNGTTLVSWAGYMCEFREFLPTGQVRDVPNLTLGNAAYRRTLFEAVGGFPGGFFPQEDQVFHRVLCQRGATIRFDPGIVVRHMHRTERQAFLAHQRRIGQANAAVLQRLNLPGSGLVRRPQLMPIALPALVALRFVRTMRACLTVEHGIILRRPGIAWLCWLGMWAWGRGLWEGAVAHQRKQEEATCRSSLLTSN